MPKIYTLRFAPSLTGNLHIGNFKIYLYNWIWSQKNKNNNLIIRLENSNEIKQFNINSKYNFLQDLEYFNFFWNQGLILNQPEKYIQSNKNLTYLKYLKIISILNTVKKIQNSILQIQTNKLGRYSSYFDVLKNKMILSKNSNFIIFRKNFKPIFNYTNPIDDIEQNVNYVIRGEDHISNTVKHLFFFKLFNKTPPTYAHIPVSLNPFNKNKVSKKDNVFSLTKIVRKGVLRNSLVNFLIPSTINTEVQSIKSIILNFNWNLIKPVNSTIDINKLVKFNLTCMQNIKNKIFYIELVHYIKFKKIYQIKNLRNNFNIFIILKTKVNFFEKISNLFLYFKLPLKTFLLKNKCYFCKRILILISKLHKNFSIYVKFLLIQVKLFAPKHLRFLITFSKVGLPLKLLLKFYGIIFFKNFFK